MHCIYSECLGKGIHVTLHLVIWWSEYGSFLVPDLQTYTFFRKPISFDEAQSVNVLIFWTFFGSKMFLLFFFFFYETFLSVMAKGFPDVGHISLREDMNIL